MTETSETSFCSAGMGTKVQSKSYLPGYHSMRDLNEDSNSFNWTFHCGDKTLPNAQYCNGFLPKAIVGAYPEYDKDAVKQTMLEHEAIFKNQVCELHRLYRIQRNLMDEIKRKSLDRNRMIPLDKSLPSSPQNTSEDGRILSILGVPLSSPDCARLSVLGSCSKSKDVEAMESRPTKVRRKMFDLELPASEYADIEEWEQFGNEKSEGSDRLFLGDVGKSDCEGNASSLRRSNGLADLNEPIHAEETNSPAYISLLGISCHGSNNGTMKNLRAEGNDNGRVQFPHVLEAGQNKVQEPPTFHNDQSKIGLWRERTTSGLDNSERIRDFSSFNHQDSFMAGSHVLGLYPVATSSEKPNNLNQRSVVPFQSYPSLNSLSKNSMSAVPGNAWYLTSSSKANPSYGRELANQNGPSLVSKDLQAPVSSINHDYFKGIDLNAALSQQGFRAVDGERKQDGNFAGLPWFGSNKNGAIDSRDPQKEPTFFPPMNQHFPDDAEARNVELGEGEKSRRILGFPVFEEPKVSESSRTASPSLPRPPETCSTSKLLDINLPCDDAASPDLNRGVLEEGMVMEKIAGEEVSGLRLYIDLNSCLTEDEEVSLIPFARNNDGMVETETRAEIDLEAPAVNETEELETECELAKMAARAIVDMSLFVDESDFSLDRLCWFSGIASSMNEIDSSEEEEEEEVDYFESMTLKLPETTPEEFLPVAFVSDRLLVEQATGERLPMARGGRRGRPGRGRQRRDFQRDILPGLTSLSRHEVTKDLQALGGGMGRATGRSWQPGPAARRNTGRNGCGGRGRRPRRDVVSVSPPPIVAAIPALTRHVSIASLTGWGKTTRRPRRQRCPPGNLKSPPLT